MQMQIHPISLNRLLVTDKQRIFPASWSFSIKQKRDNLTDNLLLGSAQRNERGQGGHIARAPNHYGDAESLWISPNAGGGAEKSQQRHKHFLQYSEFASERYQVRTWGAKLASCPGRHLASLRPWICKLSFPTPLLLRSVNDTAWPKFTCPLGCRLWMVFCCGVTSLQQIKRFQWKLISLAVDLEPLVLFLSRPFA